MYLQVPVDHEAEGGELAGTVAHKALSRQRLGKAGLKPDRLEAREGRAQPEVDLLPGVHGIVHMGVGLLGALHRSLDVSL